MGHGQKFWTADQAGLKVQDTVISMCTYHNAGITLQLCHQSEWIYVMHVAEL